MRLPVIAASILLSAAALRADIRGNVLSTSGAPLAAARVTLHPVESRLDAMRRRVSPRPEPPVVASTTTAADGSFAIQSPARIAIVEVEASGYAPSFTFAADDTNVGALALSEAAMKTGSIVADGKPVAGATIVWLANGTAFPQVGELVLRSDDKGKYSIPDPLKWASAWFVFHRDFALHRSSAEEDWSERSLSATLSKGEPVRGTVKNAAGEAVAGIELWDYEAPIAITDSNGAFTAHLEDPSLAITAYGHDLTGIGKLRSGAVAITVRPGRSISGVVTDAKSSRPIGGAFVQAETDIGAAGAIADAQGHFTIGGLSSGEHELMAFFPGYGLDSNGGTASRTADLTNSPRVERNLVLTRSEALRGKIIDENGRGVGGAFIAVIPKESPSFYIFGLRALWGAYSAPDGSFSLQQALPKGEQMDAMVICDGFAVSRAALSEVKPDEPLNIRMSRGIAVRGRVHTREGKAVAGAEIAIAEMRSGYRPSVSDLFREEIGGRFPKTNEQGEVLLHLNPGEHAFSVRAGGFAPVSLRSYQITASSGPVDVTMDAGATIAGKVLFSDGTPAVGSSVTLRRADSEGNATTDATGGFRFADLPAGKYQIIASEADSMLRQTRVITAPDVDVKIVFPPTGSISGRVIDAKTSAPITSYTISFSPAESTRPDKEIHDAAGRYTLEKVPAGEASFRVRAEGYVETKSEGITVEAGQKATRDVSLDRGLTLEGRVVDSAGKPVQEASVTIDTISPDEGYAESAETEEDGSFVLPAVPPGAKRISAGKDGYLPAAVELKPETSHYEITLSPGLSLSGIVVRGSSPVADAYVYASPTEGSGRSYGNGETDAAGHFTLRGLNTGKYDLHANSGELRGELNGIDIEHPGSVVITVDKAPTATIIGRVTGVPAGDYILRNVAANSSSGSKSVTFDANGAFRMDDAPAGDVTIVATLQSVAGSRSSEPEQLSIAPDSEAHVELRFANDLTLHGRVTLGDEPLFGASLTFSRFGSGDASVTTDAEGHYEIEGLAPGKYSISVWSVVSSSSFSIEYVARESAELNLDIAGVDIRGTVVDRNTSAPVGGVAVTVWKSGGGESNASAVSDSHGRFTFHSIAEGQYRVIALKEGYGQAVREVTLKRGEASELTLPMEPSDGLRVRTVDARNGVTLQASVVARDAQRRVVATASGSDASDVAVLPLTAGSYLVSASANGFATSTISASAPGGVLTIPLTPGGTLVIDSDRMLQGVVRLVEPDGDEYVRCWCNGIPDIELSGRHTVVEHIAPGTYTLKVLNVVDDSSSTYPVTIAEGGSVTVRVP